MQNGRGRPERSQTSGTHRVDTLEGGARLQIYKSTHPQSNPQKPFTFKYWLLQVTLECRERAYGITLHVSTFCSSDITRYLISQGFPCMLLRHVGSNQKLEVGVAWEGGYTELARQPYSLPITDTPNRGCTNFPHLNSSQNFEQNAE